MTKATPLQEALAMLRAKYCFHCRTNTHNDSECWSTRAVVPTANPMYAHSALPTSILSINKNKMTALDDAATLRGYADSLTYNDSKVEARQKHRLHEIAMRIETNYYGQKEQP